MAALLLGLVGSVIGGWPLALVGTIVGSFIDRLWMPQQHVEGPRITDRTVQAATFGQPKAIAFGRMRIAGNIFWSTDLVEHSQTSGGGKKGKSSGPTVTQYTYSVSCAVGICEGPAVSVVRIWADSKVVWDTRPKGGKSTGGTITKNKGATAPAGVSGDHAFLNATTIYLGTEDQLPNSFMEGIDGVGNTPGYRGLCYAMFKNLNLSKYGNRIPLMSFEVQAFSDLDSAAQSISEIYYKPGGMMDCYPIRNVGQADATDTGFVFMAEDFGGDLPVMWVARFDRASLTYGFYNTWNTPAIIAIQQSLESGYHPYINYANAFLIDKQNTIWGSIFGHTHDWIMNTVGTTGEGAPGWGLAETPTQLPTDPYDRNNAIIDEIVCTADNDVIVLCRAKFHRVHRAPTGGVVIDATVNYPYYNASNNNGQRAGKFLDPISGRVYVLCYNYYGGPFYPNGYLSSGLAYELWRCSPGETSFTNVTPWDTNAEIGITNALVMSYTNWYQMGLYTTGPQGRYLIVGIRTDQSVTGGWPVNILGIDLSQRKVLWQKLISENYYVGEMGIGISDSAKGGPEVVKNTTYMFWGRDYLNILGKGQHAEIFALNYVTGAIDPATVGDLTAAMNPDIGTNAWGQGSIVRVENNLPVFYAGGDGWDIYPDDGYDGVVRWTIDTSLVSGCHLSFIIKWISERCGFDPSYSDFSALVPDPIVPGYLIGQESNGRKCLEELQPVYFFDGVESDWVVKWKFRMGESLATVDEDDLGARAENVQQDVDKFVETRTQEQDIPSKVIVRYMRQASDFQTATQYVKRARNSTRSINSLTIDVPISVADETAKAAAERALYIAWVARTRLETILPRTAIVYDPADVITIVYRNGAIRASIYLDQVEQGADLTFKIGGATIDSIVIDASAPPDVIDVPGQTMTPGQVMTLLFMDIPPMRDIDTDFGFYLAAGGETSAWTGGYVVQSLDGGLTYNYFDTIYAPVPFGIAMTALPDAPHEVWDTVNTVRVTVDDGLPLESVTPTQVLTGQNFALLGSEIIGYCIATQITATVWELSCLLRGIQGTAWASGLHEEGERFVVLNPAAIRNEKQGLTLLNVTESYIGASENQDVSTIFPVAFANTGVRLKPFAGSHPQIVRDASENIALSWTPSRRTQNDLIDGAEMGIDEPVEAYEIDVLVGATVVRTIDAATPQLSYLASDQTIDGITPGAAVSFDIYQISSTIGRGYPLSFTG